MLAKRKGLTLAPIVIPPKSIGTKISEDIKYSLNEMGEEHREHIYSSIASSGVKLSNLVYSDIFTLLERPIIYVYSIEIDGEKTAIDTAFYKSTGNSRGTGLENTWLPTIGIDILSKSIIKLEEYYDFKYVINPNKISEIENPDNREEIDNLLTYKRFINKYNALTSYYLWDSHIDVVEPIVTLLDIKHSKTFAPYIQDEVKIYNQ
jgi:hypothetical protein